jgi:hypothetical protein
VAHIVLVAKGRNLDLLSRTRADDWVSKLTCKRDKPLSVWSSMHASPDDSSSLISSMLPVAHASKIGLLSGRVACMRRRNCQPRKARSTLTDHCRLTNQRGSQTRKISVYWCFVYAVAELNLPGERTASATTWSGSDLIKRPRLRTSASSLNSSDVTAVDAVVFDARNLSKLARRLSIRAAISFARLSFAISSCQGSLDFAGSIF